MSDAHRLYLRQRHFEGLEGIRCIAIVAVIWHHAQNSASAYMLTRGFLGVDIFFVLSGFLISTLLIREKSRTGKIGLANFWMRRILRLTPAYYSLLLVLLLTYLVLKPHDAHTLALFRGLPIYAFYLSNWIEPDVPNLGVTWSLATEEQFYLIWPIIEAFASPFSAFVLWAIAVLANQAFNFAIFDITIHLSVLDVTFAPILLGVALGHLLNEQRTFDLLTKVAGFPHATLFYATLLLIILNVPVSDISGLPRLTFHVITTLFICAVILSPTSATTRLLETKLVAFIGTISYGMYLYHMFCLHAARAIVSRLNFPSYPTVFLIGILITIAVASASYYLLERPFLKLKNRYSKEPS